MLVMVMVVMVPTSDIGGRYRGRGVPQRGYYGNGGYGRGYYSYQPYARQPQYKCQTQYAVAIKDKKNGNCHQSRGHDSINQNLVSGTGKLRFCSEVWKKFTCDPWILQTIAGYKIEFDSYPGQEHITKEIILSDSERDIVSQEIQILLFKRAIVRSEYEHDQFISNIFIVPKPNGKFRPVINLKYLNYFVTYQHFKQETFSIVIDLIQENDFFTSIDLKDVSQWNFGFHFTY